MTDYIDDAEITKKDEKDKRFLQELWHKQITCAENYERNYINLCKSYLRKYKGGLDFFEGKFNAQETGNYFNILYSNVETLKPLVFSQVPKPEISKRNMKYDKAATALCIVLERVCSFFFEKENLQDKLERVRNDFLITKRGFLRVAFDIEEEERENEIENVKINEEGKEIIEKKIEKTTEVIEKSIKFIYFSFDDVLIAPAKKWVDVNWIAFRHYYTKKELKSMGFSNIDDLEYKNFSDANNETDYTNDIFKRAEIFEIWDKKTKKIYWVCKNYDKCLKIQDDPLDLEDFFPIPPPLGIDSGINSIIPIPDYTHYKKQAEDLEAICEKISILTEELKYTGVFDAVLTTSEGKAILDGRNKEFTPVKNLGQNDLSSKIWVRDIVPIVNAITALQAQKQDRLQSIQEISGISDIVRGRSIASETATAQEIKGNFAISRIQPQQKEFQFFCRDIVRIMVQILVNLFEFTELAQIANINIIDKEEFINEMSMQVLQKQEEQKQQILNRNIPDQQKLQELQMMEQQFQQESEMFYKKSAQELENKFKNFSAIEVNVAAEAEKLMQEDDIISYSISIETDSTIAIDKEQKQQNAMMVANAIGNLSSSLMPALQSGGITPTAYRNMLIYFASKFTNDEEVKDWLGDEPEEKGPTIEEQAIQKEMELKERDVANKEYQTKINEQKVIADLEKTSENNETSLIMERMKTNREELLQNNNHFFDVIKTQQNNYENQ